MKNISSVVFVVKRKIIQIDEEKCNGCGECIPNCAEGALQIIEGKARLVKDSYCDGLGACLGHCPQGALKVIERDADGFDEEAVQKYLEGLKAEQVSCQNTYSIKKEEPSESVEAESDLRNWPVQLDLVPYDAPFFDGADLLILADCVPVAYPNLHAKLIKGRPLVIGCPKFDSVEGYEKKLLAIFKGNSIRTVTVVTMEVPCCGNMRNLVNWAVRESGKSIPVINRTVTVEGELY